MRDVEQEWFGMKFQGAFSTKRGTAFQDFFADIMEAAYPGVFQRIRNYGAKGDLKCDGFHPPDGSVFQVYAPRTMKETVLKAKIQIDFAGAKKYWKKRMRTWIFVHNDPDGLPGETALLIEELRAKNKKIKIEIWSYQNLHSIALKLPREKLIAMFGRPPQRQDFERLSFAPLAKVLATIREQAMEKLDEIKPVSPMKLQANALNEFVADYLRLGRRREPLVQQYFERHPDPTFGEEVAAAFRSEYRRLQRDGLKPDQVFASLQVFAGGETRGDAEHEAAVLAVLSYLFERCDIFEPA